MALSLDRCGAPLLAALVLVACSPALDWREVRVDDAALTAMFPCRPERRARDVPLAGAQVRMEMAACAAEGSTYAASFFSVQDPALVTGMLEALRSAAVANVGGAAPRNRPSCLPAPHRIALPGGFGFRGACRAAQRCRSMRPFSRAACVSTRSA